jgi:tetratricopeptide (TPR) repeat protein
MRPDEVKKFEEQLSSDKELNKNYQETLTAHRLIVEAGRLDLKATFDTYEAEMNPLSTESRVIPLWVKRSLSIAALLVVFFGVYQFGFFNKSLSTSEVYGDNFEVYASPAVVRDSNVHVQTNWEKAVGYYRGEEYEEAIEWFSETETGIPSYMVFFYKGVSYMAQNNPNLDLAIQNFNSVLESDNDYHQQALWYKGLALLQLNKRAEAMRIFKVISESRSYNFEKADLILKTKFKN